MTESIPQAALDAYSRRGRYQALVIEDLLERGEVEPLGSEEKA